MIDPKTLRLGDKVQVMLEDWTDAIVIGINYYEITVDIDSVPFELEDVRPTQNLCAE